MRDNYADRQPMRDPAATVMCRCEEVLGEQIVAAIASRARTVDDVKRRTRAGMGVCQGIFCMPAITAMMAQATGTAIDRIAPMTFRPPVRVIGLEALAELSLTETGSGETAGNGEEWP